MSGKSKSARGRGRGKALGTPRDLKKRKELTTQHVEGQVPGETTGAAKQQEPGPSREGKRKSRETVPVVPVMPVVPPQDPESSEIESGDESDSDWQGTSNWQHHVPQSIETPDFVLLSVPPSFKRIMWGGGYIDLGLSCLM